ncbi:SDR family oxidoreductase [Pseudonocardia sp. ICBG1122]|nr:SDR family oxidoreductase [Pseudonocardia pini]
MARLDGKVAVITGGAGGIGTATAALFLQEGATVVLVDREEHALRGAASELGSDRVGHVVADVTDDDQVRGYVEETVARHGRIDVLFSNAGTEGVVAPIVDYPMDAFDAVMAVNVRGVYSSIKHGLPAMQRTGGGSIIITSSIAGLHGFAGLSSYVASKHAVVGLMRSAVLEAADSGVRVNTIHPAPINNRMMRSIEEGAAPGAAQAAQKQFEGMIPAGRYGESEEVGRLALFLASDDSRYVTGATVSVDGGMSVG